MHRSEQYHLQVKLERSGGREEVRKKRKILDDKAMKRITKATTIEVVKKIYVLV